MFRRSGKVNYDPYSLRRLPEQIGCGDVRRCDASESRNHDFVE
ncbi:MAG: hypothetical protein OJF51_003563 [Nitrospira sp.]|nr:MAG: hypothetical protein OJF51_003563 [Nitrospira sp.]